MKRPVDDFKQARGLWQRSPYSFVENGHPSKPSLGSILIKFSLFLNFCQICAWWSDLKY